jgi:hypothetical protein
MTVRAGGRRIVMLATVFLVGAMVVAAFFHNEFRAQNWDPMQTRVNVDRTIRFGGTFYENGLVNKGVFEPFVYRIAAAMTSYEGFWYAISFLVLVVSGVLAWATSTTTRVFGGHRMLGRAAGVAVFFQFALGKADYAGVLYARNMIVGLYAGAWLIGLSRRWWLPGRARWAAAAVGILLGIGVQLLFVSTIAAIGAGLAAWAAIDRIDDEKEYRSSRRILIGAPLTIFVVVPLYYLARGRFDEFWSDYWTYNVYQNVATGRSLANQISYGRDVMLRYYRAWPVSFLVVVAFVAVTCALWRPLSRRERFAHLGVSVWFVGAWSELVLGQRYSTHYYSILAVPTALMAAIVVGHVFRMTVGIRGAFRTAAAWPLLAGLLSIAVGGGGHLTLGLEAASSFTSVHQVAVARMDAEPGKQRTVRAVLDLVSRPGDPLLAWTEFPWVYLQYRRVAATRWIWKSFMLGQIYFGRSSPDFVLPKTWEWFAADVAESHPAAFLEETALPVTPGTPFATYVSGGFEEAYEGADNNIYLRSDEAAQILRGDPGHTLTPLRPLGGATLWSISTGNAALPASSPVSLADVLQLSDSLCTRISGTYALAPGANGSFISFRFDRADGTAASVRLNIADYQVFSGDDGAIFDSTYLDPQASEPTTQTPDSTVSADPPSSFDPTAVDNGDSATNTPAAITVLDTAQHRFAVVVGKQSAAIVIDGSIRAAVRLTDQDRLSLQVRNGGVTFSDLHQGAAPPYSGC